MLRALQAGLGSGARGEDTKETFPALPPSLFLYSISGLNALHCVCVHPPSLPPPHPSSVYVVSPPLLSMGDSFVKGGRAKFPDRDAAIFAHLFDQMFFRALDRYLLILHWLLGAGSACRGHECVRGGYLLAYLLGLCAGFGRGLMVLGLVLDFFETVGERFGWGEGVRTFHSSSSLSSVSFSLVCFFFSGIYLSLRYLSLRCLSLRCLSLRC